MFVEFSAPDTAARASSVLQRARLGSKQLKVLLLPHIEVIDLGLCLENTKMLCYSQVQYQVMPVRY